MKVCERCGDEISTRDGDNLCEDCDRAGKESVRNAASKRAAARERRRERDEVMRSLGLVKVRGAMGGTYWE